MIRTHPQWIRAKAHVDAGDLGEVRAMTGFFSYFNTDESNVRNVPEWGGGGLLDIGCYLVNTARFIFGAEPARVAGTMDLDPAFGVDRLASMILDFGGRHAIGTCSTQLPVLQRIEIVGTTGRLELEIPFNAPSDRPCRLALDRTGEIHGSGIEMIDVDTCNRYAIAGRGICGRRARRPSPGSCPRGRRREHGVNRCCRSVVGERRLGDSLRPPASARK